MPISRSGKGFGYGKRGMMLLLIGIMLVFPALSAARAENFSLRMKRGMSYVYINEKEMFVTLTLAGGQAPYEVEVSFGVDGEVKETFRHTCETPGEYVFGRVPRKTGDWQIQAEAEDASGQKKKASAEIRGSKRVYEDEEVAFREGLERLPLTGDWRADLVTVAQFQLGQRESGSDYIADYDGGQTGATRYGAWLGDPYSDWCAAFIGYSLYRANIPLVEELGYGDVSTWLKHTQDMGAFRRAGYRPQTGDIVFLMPGGTSEISHIGIVEFSTENTIGTIEGNVSDAVVRNTCLLDDRRIAGYASMEALMDFKGVAYQQEPPLLFSVRDFSDRPGYVNRSKVNMRAGMDSASGRMFKNLEKGERLTVMAEITINDDAWVQVKYREKLGYILARYVDVDLSDLSAGDIPVFTVEEDGTQEFP